MLCFCIGDVHDIADKLVEIGNTESKCLIVMPDESFAAPVDRAGIDNVILIEHFNIRQYVGIFYIAIKQLCPLISLPMLLCS